jgi:hypothetical protein
LWKPLHNQIKKQMLGGIGEVLRWWDGLILVAGLDWKQWVIGPRLGCGWRMDGWIGNPRDEEKQPSIVNDHY